MKKLILGACIAHLLHRNLPALTLAAFIELDKHAPEVLREIADTIAQDYGSIDNWAEQSRKRRAGHKITEILKTHTEH